MIRRTKPGPGNLPPRPDPIMRAINIALFILIVAMLIVVVGEAVAVGVFG